jgi:hypothetical protein
MIVDISVFSQVGAGRGSKIVGNPVMAAVRWGIVKTFEKNRSHRKGYGSQIARQRLGLRQSKTSRKLPTDFSSWLSLLLNRAKVRAEPFSNPA